MTKQQITEQEFDEYLEAIAHALCYRKPLEPVLREIIGQLSIEIVKPPRVWKDGDVVHSKVATHGVTWYIRRSGTWHEIAYPPRKDRYRKYTDEQINAFISDDSLKEWAPR